MIRKIFLIGCIFGLLFSITNCQQKVLEAKSSSKDSVLVFFDIKNYSRAEIADRIRKIDSLKPKVIGIAVLFEGLKNSTTDSLLALAIRNSRKVVLMAEINDETLKINRSDPLFSNAAFDEGAFTIAVNPQNEGTIEYVPLFQNDYEQVENFANVMAFNYRATQNNRIGGKEVNGVVLLKKNKDIKDYKVLSDSDITLENIRGKLIIMSPFMTEVDSMKMLEYATIISSILE